jgi:hypothetical protein
MRAWLIAVAILILTSPVLSAAAPQDEEMNLDSVLKLKNAGFSDEMMITAIKAARRVSIDLSTDNLVLMKTSGLSEAVIKCMMERQTAQPSAVAPAGEANRVRQPAGRVPDSGDDCRTFRSNWASITKTTGAGFALTRRVGKTT